jgi:2-haloacid dehalogenase
MKLSDFEALSFDCYGTLIDWETGILEALQPLRERGSISAGALLEAYGQLEVELEQQYPTLLYSHLLEKLYPILCERVGVPEEAGEAARFGASVGNWPAFPDTVDALRYLKTHFKLVILSNVDRLSFAATNRRLGVDFDGIFTAEEIGSYKPDARNFEYLLTRLQENAVVKNSLLHVAQSLFHDHIPANRLGIASAWIDRRHDKDGPGATALPMPMPHYDFRFTSLRELADAHRAELS